MLNTLENLIKLARERKFSPVEGSYTNQLLTDKLLSKAKVLEEVNELIEAVEKKAEHYKKILEQCMKEGGEKILKEVPVLADAAIGENWAEAK